MALLTTCDHALDLCRGQMKFEKSRHRQLGPIIEEYLRPTPHIAGHRQRWHLEHLAVGAHHSGHLPGWKLVVENLMSEGLLTAVFATSTVAAGVNFPARTVVFFNSDRFNGFEFVPLDASQFLQMTGRAGRRGMDRVGFALAVPGKYLDVHRVARLFTSPPAAVISKIQINFSMVLNLLLSHTPAQVEELLKRSFATWLLVAKAADSVGNIRKDAAAVILFTAEKATWMALEAIQSLGGNGYINDFPTGRLLRDAKLYEIGAGTSEIRRMLIGRELFKDTMD